MLRHGVAVAVFVVGAGCLAVLTVGVVDYYHIRRFAAVEPGAIYRSGQPDDGDWERLVKSYGVRTVICLRHAQERTERIEEDRRMAAANGLRFVNVPMDKWDQPTAEEVDEIVRIMSAAENQPVLIYCKRGKDRTGLMVALYRMNVQGWALEQAVEEMIRMRGGETKPWVEAYLRAYDDGAIAASKPDDTP